MIYTYDGSFFGYLSAVFDGWHDGVEQIEDICLEAEEASLFSESRFVTTDDVNASSTAFCGNAAPRPVIISTMPFCRNRKKVG